MTERVVNLFKPKHGVCSICKVHYEPPGREENERWPNLCETHRAPKRDLWQREQAVVSWARANWEKLEKQKDEDEAATRAAYNKANQHAFQEMARMQQYQNVCPLGGLGNQL